MSISTWKKGRDEYLSRATCRNRVAKLGTNVNLYTSPSYPFTRKQGSMWNVGMKDLQQAREDFDQFFYDLDNHETYLPRHLIPFIEKSLLCMFFSVEMAEEMNTFHQHVLKNLVAKLLGNDTSSPSSDPVLIHLLALLRMIMNGHNSCMFFYIKYPGTYSATKYQKLVFTSYLASPDVLGIIPSRHPCRSFYFVDNVDMFLQAGGFRVILQRLALRDIAMREVALFCSLLHQAKPCLAQQKRRRSSSNKRRSASSVDTQVEDFFRDFLNATFARLRRMTGEELKDDEGLVDHVVGMLDMLYRDGILLGSSNDSISESDPEEYSSSEGPSSSTCDGFFAEVIEVFHLDLSKKYICCPFLAQRLLGIARLNDLIAMAQRREDLQKKTSLGMRRSLSSSSGTFLGGYADSSSSAGNKPVAKWLRVKYVVEWLSTSDVLEVIMGDKETCAKYELQEGTHLELLKRSKKIYEFVAVNGLLNENHVVLLWRTGMNQLRSGRKAVFDMLITLCGVISADLIDVVMVLLTQVPLSEYDELFTQFVKRIIMIASKQVVDLEASGTKKTLSSLVGVTGGSKLSSSAQKDVDVLNKVVNLGCCLLWNGILDGHDVNSMNPSGALRPAMRPEVESVLAASLNYIQKLWATANSSSSSSKEQQKLLSEYLENCADNIKTGVLVETSMSLIQRVADGYGNEASSASTTSSMGLSLPRAASFGASSRTSASPSDLLKDLNSKFGIILVVAEEIKNYMSSSRQHPSDLNLHERSMRRRLTFLGYIVTKSEVELSYSLMEQVWMCFNGADNTPEEREVFFEWLTNIIPDPSNFVHRAYSGNSAFASSVTTEIYQSLIKQQRDGVGIHLDVKNMGKHTFWAFERLFRLINTNERAISCAGVTGNGQRSQSVGASNQDDAKKTFVVESFDLKGLETLYEVALHAGSEDVSQEAINYLIHLHLHVGSKLVRREVWADFVSGCFERLEKKKKAGVDEESALQVHRLLVLLGTFLFQSVVQSNEAARSGSGLKDGPEELVVHVRTQDGRSAVPFRYQLRRTSLVGELRDCIAKDTGHPADRIRIVNEFKTKLTAQGHDKFTLEKARVFSSSLAAPSALPSTAKISSVSSAPVFSSGNHKRLNYVEAIMLSKVESDTVGHVQRSARDVTGPVVKSNAAGIIADAESDWRSLKSDISSNVRYLQSLFTLLSQRVDICEEAWKVLKLLASNSEMEKRTRTLNEALGIDGSIRKFPASFDWDVMLDLSCPPKLLYQLELVERFAVCGDNRVNAEPAAADEASAQQSTKGVDGMIGAVNRWSESFLKLGGKEHLKKFVLACNPRQLVTQGSLSVMCLSKLLKLLRHFVLVEFRLAEQDEEPLSDDPQDLVYQLLETLSTLKSLEEDRTSVVDSTDGATTSTATQYIQVGDAELSISAYDRPVLEDPDNIFALPSEAYLMTRTLSFIATCVLTAARDALPLLESYPSHGQIFLSCLVKSRFKPVRQEAANLIAALSTSRNKSEQDRIACCHIFLKMLSEYDGPVFDEEYYNVFTLLVSSADTLAEFAILPSCKTLCQRVKKFSVSDDSTAATNSVSSRLPPDEATALQSASEQDPGSPDSLLEALLSTLLTILKRILAVLAGRLDVPYCGRSLREVVASSLHEDEGIIDEIFHRCLFATPDNSRGGDQEETGSTSIAQAASSQYYLQKPKCRSESSREVAFALLTELSQENTSGLRYLLAQMSSQHSLRAPPVPKTLAVEPPLSASKRKLAKSSKELVSRYQTLERAKYVGLKNLGCTCYLNSTMQSFFMIPRFRRQILRFNAHSSSSVSSSSSEAKGVLYELQSLFAHLEGTAKPYYNPRSFTSALKTWDGESIDVNLQQDASEFLTSFFQQIESEMNGMGSGHGDESILNNFFGGVFSNELVAEGGRYSERAEPFHFISVPVRDRKTLKESLDGWVEGDKVSYTWEKSSDADQDGQQQEGDSMSGEKVTLDTHKRISISRLPDQLIIHLKRFEFDYERMQQIKLHDRFEFPMELDMYPYTKEGQEEKRKRSSSSASVSEYSADGPKSGHTDGGRTTAPEYSQYELVGTVVHMGTANSGHYYSFLREQDTGHADNQWFEFNDTVVSPFDPQQIPDECFGGEDDRRGLLPGRTSSASSLASSSSTSPTQRMKTRSSFMLIYARKKPQLQLSLGQPDQSTPIGFAACGLVLAFCAKLKRASSARLESLRSVAQVIAPKPIRNLIAMENRLFWRKKYLYDARCLSFTYEVIKSCLVGLDGSNHVSDLPGFEPTEARLVALQMATKFVFGTLWQGGNVSKVLEWRTALLALYHTEFGGCYWLLNTLKANEQLLLDLLVFNEHAEVRELLASVIAEAIATTSNFEFEEDAKAAETGASSTAVAGRGASGSGASPKKLPASFEFIFFLIQLMPALLSVPVEHHSQYFMTIWDFVQTGRNEGAFLVVNSVVGAIVSLLTGLGNTQPLLQGQLKRYKSKQILKSIDLSVTVLKLLSVLIRCSLPPAMDVGKNFLLPPNMAHDHVDLTASDHEVLLNERFITLLIQRPSRYSKETKPLEQILIHLCWESRKVTGMVTDKIMSGIEFEDHHDVKPYFRTLSTVLKLRDSLTSERLSDGMTKLIAVMASQQRFYKATEVSIDMLTRLAKRHGNVARWLQENHMSCAWMEKWLSGHRGVDGLLQQKRTVLVKPNSTSNWANVSVASSGLVKTIDRTVSKLLPRIRGILDPQAAMETFYDSDDNPSRLVGKRIRVKWAKDKWYEGSVEKYDEASYEHFVTYDDGDKRSYRMSEKQFYVVENTGKSPPPSNGESKKK